jgi:hypothetical protein
MLRLHPPRSPTEPPVQWRRPISRDRIERARYADRIMLRYGVVEGTHVYAQRHQARWAVRALIAGPRQAGADH